MKKLISVLLSLAMLLAFAGCGSGSTADTTAQAGTSTAAALPDLSVGYGRVSIVPKNPVALSHSQQATYSAVFEEVYMTCVAITDGDAMVISIARTSITLNNLLTLIPSFIIFLIQLDFFVTACYANHTPYIDGRCNGFLKIFQKFPRSFCA